MVDELKITKENGIGFVRIANEISLLRHKTELVAKCTSDFWIVKGFLFVLTGGLFFGSLLIFAILPINGFILLSGISLIFLAGISLRGFISLKSLIISSENIYIGTKVFPLKSTIKYKYNKWGYLRIWLNNTLKPIEIKTIVTPGVFLVVLTSMFSKKECE